MKEKSENVSYIQETGSIVTGWCPYHTTPVIRKSVFPPMEFFNSRKSPEDPMKLTPNILYSHQQVGIVQLSAGIIGLIIILITAFFCQDIIMLLLIPIIALVLGIVFFSTMIVEITPNVLQVKFGPVSVIKRTFQFDKISSYKLVKNPWYYGYGVRWIPKGTLYNIAGPDALELTLLTGKRVQIGTDEPEKIFEAFEKVFKPKSIEF